jgi:hypothetical protein
MTRELLGELEASFQLELDEEELTAWLSEVAKYPDKLVEKPDDSRWLYTAVAIDRLYRYLDLWRNLLDKCLSMEKLTSMERDIVGNLKSLLHEPKVLIDLSLTAAFFRGYFFHHFKFLQGVDPHIGKPGFLPFHILVRVFLMLQDLEHLANYQDEPAEEMNDFVEKVSQLPQEEQDKQHWKAAQFFKFARDELFKMF